MTDRKQILQIGTTKLLSQKLTSSLPKQYELLTAFDEQEVTFLLQKYQSGIALALVELAENPDTGLCFLKMLKDSGWTSRFPVLAAVPSENEDMIEEAYRLGVTDIFDLLTSPPVLIRRIQNSILLYEQKKLLKNFRITVQQDSLTKLYNHTSARQKIEKLLLQAEHGRYAMAIFDLDHFKEINDLHGHLFGDEVLKHVAGKLLQSLPKDILAARIGGDEFLIFAEYKRDTEAFAENLFNLLDGRYRESDISVSMGIALFPENGNDYETLFKCADQALYEAKENGRRGYCFYTK